MNKDWFEQGHTLLQPLVVEGMMSKGTPIDYLESLDFSKYPREQLENMARCAVMFGMKGASDNIEDKKGESN